MAINFSNCEVSINNCLMMAKNASLEQKNSVNPVYSIGYKGPVDRNITTGPISNSLKINYILETNNEPNFNLSKDLKNYFNESPVPLKLAGLEMTGYLNNYSISIKENEPIIASVDYNIYHEINGDITEQSLTNYTGYNIYNSLGIGHYWSTKIKNIGGETVGQVISLDYQFRPSWDVKYGFNNQIPTQVSHINGQETFNIIYEGFDTINYSGKLIDNVINTCSMIEINNLSYDWTTTGQYPINLYPSSGTVISHNINMSENSVIISNLLVVKNY